MVALSLLQTFFQARMSDENTKRTQNKFQYQQIL